MIPTDIFKTVVEYTPLLSIDFIAKNGDKVLLGKRINKPACGYFFTPGGIVRKNEVLNNAANRILKAELGIDVPQDIRFLGVFEHFYEDGIFENISTHYINLAYELEVGNLENFPKEQHNEFQWFCIDELMNNSQVHKYVKNYFKIGENK